MADILVGEGHNGAALSARRGDTLVVRLAENPTTGFRWTVTQSAAGVLQPLSDDFEAAGTMAPGAGGARVLRYRVSASGEASLALQLARPWEANAPRSNFQVRLSVQ